VWLGGLVILIGFLLPRGTATELGAIVPVWSRWATYAVSALVLTGVAQGLVEVGSVPALFDTAYGRLLLTKVGLVGCVLAVAWFSRRLVDPISAGGGAVAAGRLRTIVIAEASIAAVVLGVASVLVQVTPARTAVASPTESTIQTVTLTSDLFRLQAEIDPAQVGSDYVHLYAFTLDGQPADVKSWVVKAALPAKGIEPIEAAIVPITPDHATGQIDLPAAGAWTFTFTLRMSEIDQRTVTVDVPIRP
jgi:copper transport protein